MLARNRDLQSGSFEEHAQIARMGFCERLDECGPADPKSQAGQIRTTIGVSRP
jgi:hypothetical protein